LTEYVVTRWYRAPELLFKSSHYDSSVDIWSIGIILAELLGRKAMFRGTCARHQIQLIVDVLGTPSEADVASYCNIQAVELMRRPPFKEAKNFQDIFPHASADAIDILKRMLSYDPQKRPTIREALDHPFVSSLVKIQLDTIKKPAVFDASFEKDYPNEMPRFLIQFHMCQEIELIRKIQASLDADFASSLEIEKKTRMNPSMLLEPTSLLPT
jgi:serine/threonine protein kinase